MTPSTTLCANIQKPLQGVKETQDENKACGKQ
jgi:hypothetical protein